MSQCPLSKEKATDMHKRDYSNDILKISPDHLIDVMAHRRDTERDMTLALRELNSHSRSYYAHYIESVGRNIYPVIVASDYDISQGPGTGNTFTLFLEEGRELKTTPCLNSHYESYKSVCHIFIGLSAILAPHLKNPKSKNWLKPLSDFKSKIERARDSVEASPGSPTSSTIKVGLALINNVLEFASKLLDKKDFTFDEWRQFNAKNVDGIQKLMTEATRIQAELNLTAMLEWKSMMGAKLWRDLYVVIPTIWPVSAHNPRFELFRNIMDEDKVSTNIIMSEFPKNISECRTMLGRVVGDRGMARFVFGFESEKAKINAVALSTEVDFLSDDFIPALRAAMDRLEVNQINSLES